MTNPRKKEMVPPVTYTCPKCGKVTTIRKGTGKCLCGGQLILMRLG